jgi:hypothetical protein
VNPLDACPHPAHGCTTPLDARPHPAHRRSGTTLADRPACAKDSAAHPSDSGVFEAAQSARPLNSSSQRANGDIRLRVAVRSAVDRPDLARRDVAGQRAANRPCWIGACDGTRVAETGGAARGAMIRARHRPTTPRGASNEDATAGVGPSFARAGVARVTQCVARPRRRVARIRGACHVRYCVARRAAHIRGEVGRLVRRGARVVHQDDCGGFCVISRARIGGTRTGVGGGTVRYGRHHRCFARRSTLRDVLPETALLEAASGNQNGPGDDDKASAHDANNHPTRLPEFGHGGQGARTLPPMSQVDPREHDGTSIGT